MIASRSKTLSWILALAATGAVSGAHALSPWSWLKDTPASRLTEQDWSLMHAAHARALDETPDGVETSWQNPDTGNSGSITPLSTQEQGGMVCRDARIINRSQGTSSGDSTYRFCRQADGEWKILSKHVESNTPTPMLDQELQ